MDVDGSTGTRFERLTTQTARAATAVPTKAKLDACKRQVPKQLGMAGRADWFRRWAELRDEHTAYYFFNPIEFHVNGYAHEQFADSRCC